MIEYNNMAESKNLNVDNKKLGYLRNVLKKVYPKEPTSLFSSASNETFKFENKDFSKKKNKKELYTVFRRYPLVHRLVKLRADIAVPQVKFRAQTDEGQKLIEDFLSRIHPSSGREQLVEELKNLCMSADIFGTSFWDLVENRQKTAIEAIKPIHPIDVDLIRTMNGKVKRDRYGNPLGWKQEPDHGFGLLGGKKLDFERIAVFKNTWIADEVLGIPLLESIYKTVYRLMNIEEGLATSIFRHGFPLYDVTVGTPEKPPTKEQIDQATKQVQGLNYKSEFVHPPNYSVKLMESYSLGKGHDYTKDFIRGIASASGLPEWAITSSAENLSRASAEALIKESKPTINSIQNKLKLFLEGQVLAKLAEKQNVKEIPKVEFQQVPLLDAEVEASTEVLIKNKSFVGQDDNTNSYGVVTKEKMENQEPGATTSKSVSGVRQTTSTGELQKLPGIYLVEPHASWIHENKKGSIVKSEQGSKTIDQYVGRKVYLVGEDKVYGIIRLREPRKINENEFEQLRYAHLVTDEEKEKWWPKEDELYIYEFDKVQMFDKPKKFKVPQGVQVNIKEVNPEEFK